jgi:hypothetical protein
MYCPKCNQQQVSDEMRFCSRCGFPLAGVALLLENDGIIPQVNPELDQKSCTSRRRIISESAYLTLVAWAVALVGMLFVNFGGQFETVARIGTIIFFLLGLVGLIRFTYGFLFVKDSVRTAMPLESSERFFSEKASRAALPPQQSLPVSDYPLRVHTKEMLPQPSVTENTTRLLDNPPGNPGK